MSDLFFGQFTVLPLSNVQHLERRGSGVIVAVLTTSTWNRELDDYNNAAHFTREEATKFEEAWVKYRNQIEDCNNAKR